MKRRNTLFLTAIASFVLCSALAWGQAAPHFIKVSVPFEFSINGKLFPAGDYVLACTPGQIQLRDRDTHALATLITHSVEAQSNPSKPKLVFIQVDGTPALARVWLQDSRSGYELARPKRSTMIARQRGDSINARASNGNLR